MDDSLYKLFSIAVGLMLCLGALGTALHLQEGSKDYLNQVKNVSQRSGFVKEQAVEETMVMEGYELLAAIAHQLRQKDVQLGNADLVFEVSPGAFASYVVDGDGMDAWSKLSLIDSSKRYQISYKITEVGVIEEVICEGVN